MKSALFEVFFRDGSYALDFGITRRHMELIGGAMEQAGFEYVEIGHGYGLGAARKGYPPAKESDDAYLEAAAGIFKNTAYGAFFIPGVGTLDDIARAHGHGISFISIGQNITDIGLARAAAETAKTLGLHTTVCLMKAHVLPLPAFARTVEAVQAWGADCICIMDSAGSMTPAEVKQRVEAVRGAGSAKAGFHGHDNLSLATANALAAAEAGAERIDVSLGGMGRSAGNTPTEALVALFTRLGYPVMPGLAGVEQALRSVEQAGLPRGGAPRIPDILLGLYGLHSSIAGLLDEAAETHGLPAAPLYEAVARFNPVNPSRDDILRIAKELKG